MLRMRGSGIRPARPGTGLAGTLPLDRRSRNASFQTAKTETGLNQYQVRRYDAWYRHATLAILAHAYLAVTARAPKVLAAASSTSRSARSAVSWHT
jgi:hypothetical protein